MMKRTSFNHSSMYTKRPHLDDCLPCHIKFARVKQADNDGGFMISACSNSLRETISR